jgi:HEPN domain-containing protein
MTPDELQRKEAAKWLREAAKDRNAAQALLEIEPARSVFHSQQVAEKAAKAFLTFSPDCISKNTRPRRPGIAVR